MSEELKPEITVNGHSVPERIWIDFRSASFSGHWRVYTAPNAFAEAEYSRSTDTAEVSRLREAAQTALSYIEARHEDLGYVYSPVAAKELNKRSTEIQEQLYAALHRKG